MSFAKRAFELRSQMALQRFSNTHFYLVDRTLNEVAVFTEHCGYHIFPVSGTEIEVFESKGSDFEPE